MRDIPDAAGEPVPRSPPGRSEAHGPTASAAAYSPLVRRLAEEFGVDLSAVEGTGPGGRVTRGDVHAAAFPDEAGSRAPQPSPPYPPAAHPRTAEPLGANPPGAANLSDPGTPGAGDLDPSSTPGAGDLGPASTPGAANKSQASTPGAGDQVAGRPAAQPGAAPPPASPAAASPPPPGVAPASQPASSPPVPAPGTPGHPDRRHDPPTSGELAATTVEPPHPPGRFAVVSSAIRAIPMPPAVPVAADRGELERQHGTPIRRPLSDSRRTALAGLTRAWTVPQFSATVDVNVDQLIRARDRLVGRSGADLPIEALLIRLALPALDEFPSMNAMLDGGEVVLFDHRHVGFTCATGDGLLVPVVRWADRQSLEDLGQAVADLAERAARHRLQPGEVGGQTFTVTDAGALGVKSMTPILPLATTAIVAYGEPQRMVRMLGDAPREVPIMTVTGTFDHRVIDGVEAARFLTTIGAYLEDPILAFAA